MPFPRVLSQNRTHIRHEFEVFLPIPFSATIIITAYPYIYIYIYKYIYCLLYNIIHPSGYCQSASCHVWIHIHMNADHNKSLWFPLGARILLAFSHNYTKLRKCIYIYIYIYICTHNAHWYLFSFPVIWHLSSLDASWNKTVFICVTHGGQDKA